MDIDAITVAISDDNVDELKHWLDTTPDAVAELDADAESRLLHLAVHRNARVCLRELLGAGAGGGGPVRNSNGTELWVTAAGQGLWCLRALVEAGRREQGEVQHPTWNTALHVVCLRGKDITDLQDMAEEIRLLLHVGASSMMTNKADKLPVDLALASLAKRSGLREAEAQLCLEDLLEDMRAREASFDWAPRIEEIMKHMQNFVHTTHLPRAHRRLFVNRDNQALSNHAVLLCALLRGGSVRLRVRRRKLADDVLRLLTRVVGYDSFAPAIHALHGLFFLLLSRGHFPAPATLLQSLRLRVVAPGLFLPMLHAVLSLAPHTYLAEYRRLVTTLPRAASRIPCPPRPLQEMCRAALYQQVRDGDVLFYLNELPLPPGLKKYLVQL